jgi:hypothetical protein
MVVLTEQQRARGANVWVAMASAIVPLAVIATVLLLVTFW